MKRTYISAIVMFAAGGCLAFLSKGYTPVQYNTPVPVTVEEALRRAEPETLPSDEDETAEEETSAPETEAVWQPSVEELNLSWIFPEGADMTDSSQSLGSEAFRILMTENGQWISNIYNYYDTAPEKIAARLSLPRSRVLGNYDPREESHDPGNPDTWTINSFKNVHMNVTDGDGRPISLYSNVIEIMSMANQYTYYKNPTDYDLFTDYARKLWNASHSFSVTMSDVYYCSGCMDEAAEQRELEEMAAQESNELLLQEDSAEEEDSETASQALTPVIEAGRAKSDQNDAAETAGTDQEGIAETAGADPDGGAETAEADQDGGAETAGTNQEGSAETSDMSGGSTEATPSTSAYATTSNSENNTSENRCPGHIDLIIHMQIRGLSESNGLFAADTIGNDPANIEEGGWPGWTEEMKEQAHALSAQDWYQKYGLSISLVTMTNPLTPSEINAYMAELPGDLSATRKALIRYALSSVGKIPYHWGGKASSPGYDGNHFGTLVSADTEGRILKGLDCSGWINWVYWSVTGTRLPYESTSGLVLCGTKIGRNELQPGDIVVRTGEDAHVIMFLGWTEDGRIRCIHESSAGINNVTVSVRDASWPYYIRILNE